MQVSFGRAIKLVQNFERKTPIEIRENFPIEETVLTMADEQSSKHSSIYDKENSDKISKFLRAQFSDYNKKTGVVFKEYKGSMYAITGKDINKLKYAKCGYANTMSHIIENGKEKRPKSSLTFNVNKQGKLKEIVYYSTQNTKNGKNAACEILTLEV